MLWQYQATISERSMFRFLLVFLLQCNDLPGVLSPSITHEEESRNFAIFGNHASQCNWECVIVSKSALTEMKARIGMYRIVPLDLTLGKYVDDKCLNQTDSDNLSKLAKVWMWSTVNTLTRERNMFYRPQAGSNGSFVTSFIKSRQGELKVEIACTFNRSEDPTKQKPHSSINDLIAHALMEGVEELNEVWRFGAALCYKGGQQNRFYSCLSFDKSTSTATPSKSLEWPVRIFSAGNGVVTILVVVMSTLFFPVLLCLLSPTHVSSIHNIDLIVLEGSSHTGIRSLVANLVSQVTSKLGNRKCFLVWLLTLFAILSFPLGLYPVFSNPYLDKHVTDPGIITSKVMIIFALLCSIRGLIRVLFTKLSFLEPCFVCDYIISKQTYHQTSDLEDEIKQHLKIQPLIIAKCSRNFFTDVFCNKYWSFLRNCYLKSRFRLTSIYLYIFFVLAILIPLVLSVLLALCLVFILALAFYSCPMSTIFDLFVNFFNTNGDNRPLMASRIVLLAFLFITSYVGGLSLFLFMLANAFIKTLETILSLENLPSLTLLVLTSYYCSSSYYSFTGKYDDLAAKVYSFLKKRVQQDRDNENALYLIEHNNKKAIPKRLFDRACQETVPLAENLCKFLFRIVIILISFYLIYTIVKETSDVPDRMKNTATFLVAVTPMIMKIVVPKKEDKTHNKMKELQQEEIDEQIESIVDEYYQNPADWIESPNQNRLQ